MREQPIFLLILLWGIMMVLALLLRPLMPIDETRYLTVAWEMWRDNSFLVPHLNGEQYSHKPPLLFWMIHLGWSVFGVVEWWARLVSPLFGLASLLLTARLARALWPQQPQIANLAPIMLFGGFYWLVFSTMAMFDMLITFFTLLGMLGLVSAWQGKLLKGFALFAIAIGFGVLSKGPVILLHILPTALFAPYWGPHLSTRTISWGKWYFSILLAFIGGAFIALAWAIPAAISGGQVYADAIFWGQSAGRMVKSFAHQSPVWFYFIAVPLMIFPWIAWPSLWRAFWGSSGHATRKALRHDGGLRLITTWFLISFIAFSLISGKLPHYLLPEIAALTLLLASALVISAEKFANNTPLRFDIQLPVIIMICISLLSGILLIVLANMQADIKAPKWISYSSPWPAFVAALIGSVLFVIARKRPQASLQTSATLISSYAFIVIASFYLSMQSPLAVAYDLTRAAQTIKQWQDEDRPVAISGKYHGQFHFLGRLQKPVTAISSEKALLAWSQKNPEGIVITVQLSLPELPAPLYHQLYRGRNLAMWKASDLLIYPAILQ